GRASWREFISHEAGRYILELGATRDYLIRAERVEALPRIVVRHTSGDEHTIAMAEEAYAIEPIGGYEYDTAIQRYSYNSPTTPMQWFDYDMAGRTRTLRKTQEIPSGHDPAKYEARRLFATAPDGARVPITVLMLRGARTDGAAPLFLYGYGSY